MPETQAFLGDESYARLIASVNKLVDAVRVTRDPKIRTVFLEGTHGEPVIANAGVIVAVSNASLLLVRSAPASER